MAQFFRQTRTSTPSPVLFLSFLFFSFLFLSQSQPRTHLIWVHSTSVGYISCVICKVILTYGYSYVPSSRSTSSTLSTSLSIELVVFIFIFLSPTLDKQLPILLMCSLVHYKIPHINPHKPKIYKFNIKVLAHTVSNHGFKNQVGQRYQTLLNLTSTTSDLQCDIKRENTQETWIHFLIML